MPSPVSFLLSLATFPANYNSTPAQFATDLVNRLTITPSAPWSSFQYGGSIPTSDVGPILFLGATGYQWMVWSAGTGTYVDLRVNGDGLINNSVPLSAITLGNAGGIFTWDAGGNPFILQSSNPAGTVLTSGGLGVLPSWQTPANPVVPAFFEMTTSTPQTFTSSTAPAAPAAQTINFNVVRDSLNVTPDTTNHWVSIPANQTWYVYFQAQLDYANGSSSTTWQVTANIIDSAGAVVGGLVNSANTLGRQGLHVSGILLTSGSPYNVFVQLLPTETVGSSTNISMGVNSQNQRFGGFRLF